MVNKIKTVSLFIALLIACTNSSFAQKKKHPSAILLQVRSEHNRIEALTKAGRQKELNEVILDAQNAAAAMKRDFEDNFSFCPVYYFVDTNIDLIKQKRFDGILLASDGTPVADPVITSSSTDYYIVFFGYPVSQPKQGQVVKDPQRYKTSSGEPFGKGLVINNDEMQQLSYIIKFNYNDIFLGKEMKKKYFYESKHFEIDYFPLAKELNKKLKDHPIKQTLTH
ncbi:MAG: hypothetical protein K0Q79_3541 [Flavipsychrobacter sp.]|jgi:hypothetical protein|nr:hypothetical protein [Flavipsychrobacter sp.]